MDDKNPIRDKDWRRRKWKGIMLSQSNVDEYMRDLRKDTKGQYITQGVSFNKDDALQMNLLKQAFLTHGTFSGFIKHLLYSYFANQTEEQKQIHVQQQFILQQNGESKLHDERVLDNGDSRTRQEPPITYNQREVMDYNQEEQTLREVNEEDSQSEIAEYTTTPPTETPPAPPIQETVEELDEEEQKRLQAKKAGLQNFLKSNPQAKKPT